MSRAVEVGDKVEDFVLPDETGTERSLSELLDDGPVVVFFYPAALTAGCTAEACHFRDLAAEFAAAGARPVGISGDPVDRQQEFAGRNSLGFPCCPTSTGRSANGSASSAASRWPPRNASPSSSAGTARSWRSSAANCA